MRNDVLSKDFISSVEIGSINGLLRPEQKGLTWVNDGNQNLLAVRDFTDFQFAAARKALQEVAKSHIDRDFKDRLLNAKQILPKGVLEQQLTSLNVDQKAFYDSLEVGVRMWLSEPPIQVPDILAQAMVTVAKEYAGIAYSIFPEMKGKESWDVKAINDMVNSRFVDFTCKNPPRTGGSLATAKIRKK